MIKSFDSQKFHGCLNGFLSVCLAQRHANIMNAFRTRTNVYYIQFELEFLDLGERHLLETGRLFSFSNKRLHIVT